MSRPSLSQGSSHTLIAGCKVNLRLKITGVLENGWHELDSLFIPINEPCDELTLTVDPNRPGLIVRCDAADIDLKNNTLTKAYSLYAEASGFAPGLSLRLKKGAPIGSGLGGGSSDAAALLLWLQKYAPKPLSQEDLASLACKVGADTPFFLKNTPCIVQGIGEKLTPIPIETLPIWGNTLVIISPNVHISTPWAYAEWDQWFSKQKTLSDDKRSVTLTKKYAQGRSSTVGLYKKSLWLENDFEKPIFTTYPELGKHKETFLASGARAAALSGSGSSMWALFTDNATALRAEKDFQSKNIQTASHILI